MDHHWPIVDKHVGFVSFSKIDQFEGIVTGARIKTIVVWDFERGTKNVSIGVTATRYLFRR